MVVNGCGILDCLDWLQQCPVLVTTRSVFLAPCILCDSCEESYFRQIEQLTGNSSCRLDNLSCNGEYLRDDAGFMQTIDFIE